MLRHYLSFMDGYFCTGFLPSHEALSVSAALSAFSCIWSCVLLDPALCPREGSNAQTKPGPSHEYQYLVRGQSGYHSYKSSQAVDGLTFQAVRPRTLKAI